MEYRGYSEQELVSNRAAVLLFGGTDAERMDWAREAAGHFASEASLLTVGDVTSLPVALARNTGVVFMPDLLALGADAQVQILQCLRGIEERPKIILGLSISAEQAAQRGQLREDLAYRLQLAHVNLDSPGLKENLLARRRAKEEELGSVKTLVSPGKSKSKPKKSKGKAPKKAAKKAKGKKKAAKRAAKKSKAKKSKKKQAKKKKKR